MSFGRIASLFVFVFVGALVAGGYVALRGRVIEAVYRDKLEALAGEYESLRSRYNEAVRHTAVTELVVEEGDIDVIVRGVDGVLQRIETGLDPEREVHIDFVVKDGRLFIRRVYDDETAPAAGQVIDPELVGVDWKDPLVARGLSVYRGELASGRWVVSTTGNGALDLIRVGALAQVDLRSAPPVRDFEQVGSELAAELGKVHTADVLQKGLDLLR